MGRLNYYRRGHELLWEWLSRNPEANKADWFVLIFNTAGYNRKWPVNKCFACDAAREAESKHTGTKPRFTYGVTCSYCPLVEWSTPGEHCEASGSLFVKWKAATDPAERTELAERIAGMEWKEDSE